jgi:hypothetical protein
MHRHFSLALGRFDEPHQVLVVFPLGVPDLAHLFSPQVPIFHVTHLAEGQILIDPGQVKGDEKKTDLVEWSRP